MNKIGTDPQPPNPALRPDARKRARLSATLGIVMNSPRAQALIYSLLLSNPKLRGAEVKGGGRASENRFVPAVAVPRDQSAAGERDAIESMLPYPGWVDLSGTTPSWCTIKS